MSKSHLYTFRAANWTLKDYADNMRADAELIYRQIAELKVKADTLRDLSFRLESDLVQTNPETWEKELELCIADKQALQKIINRMKEKFRVLLNQIQEDIPTDTTTRHFKEAYQDALLVAAEAEGREA